MPTEDAMATLILVAMIALCFALGAVFSKPGFPVR